LKDSVRDTVRQRTYERYESIVRVHIKPVLGRVRLKALTPAHVRNLYREKLDAGLAPRTVNYIHTTLHKALKNAVTDGLIPRNPSDAVKHPDPRNPRYVPSPKIKPAHSWRARKVIVSTPCTCWPCIADSGRASY
jgi:integrase